MAEPTLLGRVLLAREGADVERCHAHPHLLRYSVGHHSHGVAAIAIHTWQWAHGKLPRAELIVAALYHDVPERVTGDVPQPVKLLLGGTLDAVEARVLTWMGVNVELTELEARWLECSDRVELWMWSQEEARRGNVGFLPWVGDYDAHFANNPPPRAFRTLMDEARYVLGGTNGRLSFAALKEIAGL